ncbi:hypothetical protein [uncultured Gelidibacter sp.]|uniref:hypothetical protein n=1 Tax=uncultured Gelidibacter sp. TaxID=259318 RepID=UPI002637F81C|nr:hypothetical protein [uncultured Gelidibacter sp.]
MENPIQTWIESDKKVSDLINEIENSELSEQAQAELAMDKLCLMFDLPKMPEDTSRYEDYYEENEIDDARSVFQEYALLKYFYPEQDPRSLILWAVYNLIHLIGVDIDEILINEFGEDFPDDCIVGYRGKGIDGEIVFPLKEGKNWFELGCIAATKIVKHNI